MEGERDAGCGFEREIRLEGQSKQRGQRMMSFTVQRDREGNREEENV